MNDLLCKLIHLADLHFGHNLKKEEVELIKNYINTTYDKDTVIAITGDLFHKRLKFEDPQVVLCLDLLYYLDSLGIPIIIIMGTISHDFDYMDTMSEIGFKNISFIRTLEEFELNINNRIVKFLAIPEESIDDQKEYYKDTLYNEEKFYDVILLHGTILKMAKYNPSFESVPMKKSPLFEPEDLIKRAKLTAAGHIHIPLNYKNRIFYVGSWSRHGFGEEEQKFLNIYNISASSNEVLVLQKENILAPIFLDIEITNIDTSENDVENEEISKEENSLQENKFLLESNDEFYSGIFSYLEILDLINDSSKASYNKRLIIKFSKVAIPLIEQLKILERSSSNIKLDIREKISWFSDRGASSDKQLEYANEIDSKSTLSEKIFYAIQQSGSESKISIEQIEEIIK